MLLSKQHPWTDGRPIKVIFQGIEYIAHVRFCYFTGKIDMDIVGTTKSVNGPKYRSKAHHAIAQKVKVMAKNADLTNEGDKPSIDRYFNLDGVFWIKSGRADHCRNTTKTHACISGSTVMLCGAKQGDMYWDADAEDVSCKRCQRVISNRVLPAPTINSELSASLGRYFK